MTDYTDDELTELLLADRATHDAMHEKLRSLSTEIANTQARLAELREARHDAITTARHMAWTWQRIGDALGIPRNAVQQIARLGEERRADR